MKEQIVISYLNPYLTVEQAEYLASLGWDVVLNDDNQEIIFTE